MSTYYYFYVEKLIGGKWVNVCPKVEGKIIPIYNGCSSVGGILDNVWHYKMDGWDNVLVNKEDDLSEDDYQIYYVDVDMLRDYTKRAFDREGIVTNLAWSDYVNGYIENPNEVDKEFVDDIPFPEKMCSYHQWLDRDGDLYYAKELYKRYCIYTDMVQSKSTSEDNPSFRLIVEIC